MKQVQQLTRVALVLLIDLLLFTWHVVRRVILPTRSRKGNLLSSLLTFFVGLLERIVSFEKSIIERPVVFTHKYVRQGLIIAVGFLFLLSSVEWTIGAPSSVMVNGAPEAVACAMAAGKVRSATPRPANWDISVPGRPVLPQSFVSSLSSSQARPPVVGKRWLRLGVVRI